MMGIIADRTHTRWGKYRPYLLWISLPFAVCGILMFTTPDFGPTGKLVWAYVTYILMMTVYTAINVPYGAMLGVMTDDSDTKTVFSSYRMFFAYVKQSKNTTKHNAAITIMEYCQLTVTEPVISLNHVQSGSQANKAIKLPP